MFKNFNFASILSIIIIGLFIGVVFVYADWTAPISSPPTCAIGDPGCDAPINVSSNPQYKAGALGIGGILRGYSDAYFDGNVGIGVSPEAGYGLTVLGGVYLKTLGMRSNGGIVAPRFCLGLDCITSWPSGGGGGGVSQIIAGTNITVSPSGGTGAVTINAAGGAGGDGLGSGNVGTSGYITKWTGNTSIGNSIIQENANGIGIGISPAHKLDVNGSVYIRGDMVVVGRASLTLGESSTDTTIVNGSINIGNNAILNNTKLIMWGSSYQSYIQGAGGSSGGYLDFGVSGAGGLLRLDNQKLDIAGDVVANSNTPSNCSWSSGVTTCSSGQFMAGYNNAAGKLYCCEL